MRYKLGELVELVSETNSELKYGLDDIVGVTLDKQLIPTRANLSQTELDSFSIVRPNDFVYNPRTHGKKIGLGYNTSNRCYISTWNNHTFRVKPQMRNVILSDYLYMHFLLEKWDREACFHSWGSSTVVLLWSSFCEMSIDVPSLVEQQKIVRNYHVVKNRINILNKTNEVIEKAVNTIFADAISTKSDNDMNTIYDAFTVINGSSFSSDLFNSEGTGYPLVRIRDLSDCCPNVYTTEQLPNIEYVDAGDVLVGMDGEFVPHIWFGDRAVLNQRVCKIVPAKEYIHPLFLLWTLKPILLEIQRTQGGTTVIHIGKQDFDKMECIHLTELEHKRFYEAVDPFYSLSLANSREVLKLNKLLEVILSLMS